MALPWLRLFDAALGLADLIVLRKATRKPDAAADRLPATGDPGLRALGSIEARLAGVVVAALKEAFERDNRRLDFEREQAQAERLRAERSLRLELRRQAVDRELGRLRLIAGLAVTSWLGALVFSTRIVAAGGATRVTLGVAWVLLLGALGVALGGHSNVARSISPDDPDREGLASGLATALSTLLLLAGLVLVSVAALIA